MGEGVALSFQRFGCVRKRFLGSAVGSEPLKAITKNMYNHPKPTLPVFSSVNVPVLDAVIGLRLSNQSLELW